MKTRTSLYACIGTLSAILAGGVIGCSAKLSATPDSPTDSVYIDGAGIDPNVKTELSSFNRLESQLGDANIKLSSYTESNNGLDKVVDDTEIYQKWLDYTPLTASDLSDIDAAQDLLSQYQTQALVVYAACLSTSQCGMDSDTLAGVLVKGQSAGSVSDYLKLRVKIDPMAHKEQELKALNVTFESDNETTNYQSSWVTHVTVPDEWRHDNALDLAGTQNAQASVGKLGELMNLASDVVSSSEWSACTPGTKNTKSYPICAVVQGRMKTSMELASYMSTRFGSDVSLMSSYEASLNQLGIYLVQSQTGYYYGENSIPSKFSFKVNPSGDDTTGLKASRMTDLQRSNLQSAHSLLTQYLGAKAPGKDSEASSDLFDSYDSSDHLETEIQDKLAAARQADNYIQYRLKEDDSFRLQDALAKAQVTFSDEEDQEKCSYPQPAGMSAVGRAVISKGLSGLADSLDALSKLDPGFDTQRSRESVPTLRDLIRGKILPLFQK